MDVDRRDWGSANPLDYIPIIGFIYRFYWLVVARRGMMIHREHGWVRATRKEFGRLLFSLISTVALLVYIYLGNEFGLKISILLVLGGVFIFKVASLFLTDI